VGLHAPPSPGSFVLGFWTLVVNSIHYSRAALVDLALADLALVDLALVGLVLYHKRKTTVNCECLRCRGKYIII
jgi:hypothetical protein